MFPLFYLKENNMYKGHENLMEIKNNRDRFEKSIIHNVNNSIDYGYTKVRLLEIIDGSDNDYFFRCIKEIRKIKKYLNKYFDIHNQKIKIEVSTISSVVLNKVIIHPSIQIKINNGLIRYSPTLDGGIEISSIYTSNPNVGEGSLLMRIFFWMLLSSNSWKFPNSIKLVCVGMIETDYGGVFSSISIQTRFFRKFGFRVFNEIKEKGKLKGVEMKFHSDKVSDEFLLNILSEKNISIQ
jgi:hypothetical protein